jgi:hypothetical protein
VKLADKVCLQDMASSPPTDDCRAHARWAGRVGDGLRGVNATLGQASHHVYDVGHDAS